MRVPLQDIYTIMSSLNKNDTSSLNDFDTLDMCIINISSMINIGGVLFERKEKNNAQFLTKVPFCRSGICAELASG